MTFTEYTIDIIKEYKDSAHLVGDPVLDSYSILEQFQLSPHDASELIEDIIFNMIDFTTICGNNFMKIFSKLDKQFSLSHRYFSYGTTITSYDAVADAIGSMVDMYALAKFIKEYREELLEELLED